MSQTNIEDIYYDDKENLLTITYKGGSKWAYHPSNPETYMSLIAENCLAKAIHDFTRSGVVGIKL